MKSAIVCALVCAGAVLLSAHAELGVFDGAFKAVDSSGRVYLQSGEHGMWRVKTADGKWYSAAQFRNGGLRGGKFTETVEDGAVVSSWTSSDLDVVVVTRIRKDGSLSTRARVTPKNETIEEMSFPSNLRFAPADVARFVYPGRGNETTGMALNEKFFTSKCSYWVPYPPLFADWARIETKSGACAQVFGVQRRGGFAPWKNPNPFVPGATIVAGDAKGGYYAHSVALWIRPGEAGETPEVRLTEGGDVDSSLQAYLAENGLGRSLRSKLPRRDGQAFLDRLAASPLFLLWPANANQISAAVEKMPMPTLIHIHDFMPHGYDVGYPDFFPPRASFGTNDEFKRMIAAIHRRGGLFMPYTNPCWWGAKPVKSSALEKNGLEPVARNRDGTPQKMDYGANSGFNLTYWHPAVKEANRTTSRTACGVYGVDILFQDQCGSLPWYRDFSPHSPSVMAHEEGMISIVEEDCHRLPLYTEDGFDMVADSELGLTGCAWGTIPLVDMVGHRLHKDGRFPADTWVLEPVAQRLFRDKLLFYHHNLAGFAKNERVLAWTLALGYNIVVQYSAQEITQDPQIMRWYAWLQAVQSRVMARTVGGKVGRFVHDRMPLLARGIDPASSKDDGSVVADYGDYRFRINLGDVPRTVDGVCLAPYGWWVEGPGVKAGTPENGQPFIEADGERIVYEKGK